MFRWLFGSLAAGFAEDDAFVDDKTNCPFCGNIILMDEQSCRWCHEKLDPSSNYKWLPNQEAVAFRNGTLNVGVAKSIIAAQPRPIGWLPISSIDVDTSIELQGDEDPDFPVILGDYFGGIVLVDGRKRMAAGLRLGKDSIKSVQLTARETAQITES